MTVVFVEEASLISQKGSNNQLKTFFKLGCLKIVYF